MVLGFWNRRSFIAKQKPKQPEETGPGDAQEPGEEAESSGEKRCWWIDSEFVPYSLLEKYKEKTDTACETAVTGKKSKGKSKGKKGSKKAANADAIALEKVSWTVQICIFTSLPPSTSSYFSRHVKVI